MGGTDDPSNIEYITVKEHAERHKTLWLKYSKTEDYIAWKSLSKQMGKEELFKLTSSIGGKNNRGKPKTEEHKRKMSESSPRSREPLPESTKDKISYSMLGNSNSRNHSSSDYRDKQSQAMKRAWARRKGLV